MLNKRGFLSWLVGLPVVGSLLNCKSAPAATTTNEEKRPSAKVRLWTLYNPSREAFEKLGNILAGWDGKSDLDILWSDDLLMQELNAGPNDTDVVCTVELAKLVKTENGERPYIRLEMECPRPRFRIIRREE